MTNTCIESHRDTADGQAAKHLVAIRSGQRVSTDVILEYLRRIEYDSDGYAELIHVPAYENAEVVVDPTAQSVHQFSSGVGLVSMMFSKSSGQASR